MYGLRIAERFDKVYDQQFTLEMVGVRLKLKAGIKSFTAFPCSPLLTQSDSEQEM